MSKSPAKKKTTSSSSSSTKEKEKVVITPEVEKEVEALLKAGTWKEMKEESSGKTYFYNKATKKTCWDLKKEIAKQKAEAGAGATTSAAAAAVSESSASEAPSSPTASPKGKKSLKSKSSLSSANSSLTVPIVKETETAQPTEEEIAAAAAAKAKAEAEEIERRAKEEAEAEARAAFLKAQLTLAQEKRDLEMREQILKQQEAAMEANRNKKLRDLLRYTDPIDRLVDENQTLQHLIVTGSHGHVALDFQVKYDAIVKSNHALTVQMGSMKTEYEAMQRALNAANLRVHQLQQQIDEANSKPTTRSKDEEVLTTLAFLREQNRDLTTQVADLSLMLTRGLHEVAFRAAFDRSAAASASNPNNNNVSSSSSSFTAPQAAGKVLESYRSSLCGNCSNALSRLRDSTIPAHQLTSGPHGGGGMSGAQDSSVNYSAAQYATVGETTNSHHNAASSPMMLSRSGVSATPQQQQHHQSNSTMNSFTSGAPSMMPQGGASSSYHNNTPPALFGGFMVRTPRV